MNKKLVSLITLILIASMLLASCNGGGTQNPGTTASGDVITDPTTIERKDWKVKEYDPPIEVRVVASDLPYITLPKGDTRENNNWTRAYEKELGIKTKFDWVVDSSQLAQKVETTLATGDLPDVLQVSASQLQSLVEQDMIEDLSTVYLQYASDDLKACIEQAGPEALDSATFNGRLMAVPFTGNSKESIPGMWVRQDWLDKLGLKVPTTVDELINTMIAFAQKDPDGNGKNDTICGTFNKVSFYGSTAADALAYCFGAYPATFIEKDGKVAFGGVQPEMKTALETYKKLYDAGAINKEFTTIDLSKAQEANINDKVGIIFGGYYSAASELRAMVTQTKKTDVWKFYEIPSIDGKNIKPPFETATFGYHVVKKGFSNPEVVVKLANMFVQEFYINTTDKERYLQLVQNEQGNNAIWALSLCQVYRPLNNIVNYKNLDKAINGGDPSAMDKVTFLGRSFYNGGLTFRDKKGEEKDWLTNWCWWAMCCPENKTMTPAMAVTAKIIDENRCIPNKNVGLLTPAMEKKYGFLLQKQSEVFQKFITGTRPLSEWDKYVEEFNVNGGEEVTNSLNEWYANRAPAENNIFLSTWKKG